MPEEIRPEELIKWEEENRPFINAYAKAISAGNQMHTEAYQNWVKMQEENFKKYFDEQSKAHKQSIDNWYETRRRSIMEQFERSKNYTNLIVIAGYAGYFWMLEKFRDDMDQRLVKDFPIFLNSIHNNAETNLPFHAQDSFCTNDMTYVPYHT